MDKFLQSGASALFALFFLLTFASCDSGGSSSSGPSWAGDWELTSATFADSFPDRVVWSITEEEITQLETEEDGCDSLRFEVIGSDDNTLTVRNAPPEEDEIAEFLFETEGDNLTATVVDTFGGDGLEPGGEIFFKQFDGDPQAELGC